MSLADTIRTGVAVASRVTTDLQVTVAHSAPSGRDLYGKPTYGAAVNRDAVVSYEQRAITDKDGQQRISQAQVLFLANVTVAEDDKLVLPNGSTGPILRITQPADPAGGGYLTQVWLGFMGRA